MTRGGDHAHRCVYCNELYSCPLDKRDCKISWKTDHNDHYLALVN
ncbi:hypothetical protein NTE_02398 [Candidatus Nitrososphaera evergladensis SR1]|uniref:Uncharacterized protein n=1 Tax=Candidatus Nitrososphaera evergladensis SR1 TaxID=1459636 RepID=A0A075MTB5_9ARCH|nr:hypothetical protein NTE_02398 [Candidatus Nitrososphaera evergladensis SR1]